MVRKWASWRHNDAETVAVNVLNVNEETRKEHSSFEFLVEHGRAAAVIKEAFRCYNFRKTLALGASVILVADSGLGCP